MRTVAPFLISPASAGRSGLKPRAAHGYERALRHFSGQRWSEWIETLLERRGRVTERNFSGQRWSEWIETRLSGIGYKHQADFSGQRWSEWIETCN